MTNHKSQRFCTNKDCSLLGDLVNISSKRFTRKDQTKMTLEPYTSVPRTICLDHTLRSGHRYSRCIANFFKGTWSKKVHRKAEDPMETITGQDINCILKSLARPHETTLLKVHYFHVNHINLSLKPLSCRLKYIFSKKVNLTELT